jgi:hypothetical protein
MSAVGGLQQRAQQVEAKLKAAQQNRQFGGTVQQGGESNYGKDLGLTLKFGS